MIPIKSPLRYPGGKSRALKNILPLIPEDIAEFREPFVGGGSVFLAVKHRFAGSLFHRHTRFAINDINPDVASFWRSVRDDAEALCERIRGYHQRYSSDGRALYELLKSDQFTLNTDLDRAVRFFIMNRITFSGVMDSGGYSQQAFENRFTASSIDRIQRVAPVLAGTEITSDDYEGLVHHDGTGVFVFLDPPYYSATKSRLYGNKGDLHLQFDHERFAETMRACPHRWLITYDDSPYIRELFGFAHISRWTLQYGMNNYKQKTAGIGHEVFISNYPLT